MPVESGEGGGGRRCSETFLRAAVRTNSLTALVCIRGFKGSGISQSVIVMINMSSAFGSSHPSFRVAPTV